MKNCCTRVSKIRATFTLHYLTGKACYRLALRPHVPLLFLW